MEQGSVQGLLLRFSGPAIIANVVAASYNIVDAIFIGRLGLAALGAAAVSFPIMLIYSAMTLGISVGASSLISRRLGAKEHGEANRVAAVTITTFIIYASVITLICLPSLQFLLRMFGANDEVMPYAMSYMTVETAFILINFALVVLAELVRAEGNPILSSTASIVSALMNCIWDPILGFGIGPFPRMGMAGFALATTVGRGIGVLILLIYLISGKSSYRFKPSYFLPNLKIIGEIYRIGVSSILRTTLDATAWGIASNIASRFGIATLAVFGVAYRTYTLGGTPAYGLGQGILPLIGYNYGAKRKERVGETMVKAGLISLIWGIVCWLAAMLFTTPILSLFGTAPEYLAIGTNAFRIFATGFLVSGPQIILIYFWRGIGKGLVSGIVSSSRPLILMLVFLLLSRIFASNGLWMGYPVADFLAIVVTLIWFIIECRNLGIPLRLRYNRNP